MYPLLPPQDLKKERDDESSNQGGEREKSPPRNGPGAGPGRGRKRKHPLAAVSGAENMSSAASTCSEDSERSNDFYGEAWEEGGGAGGGSIGMHNNFYSGEMGGRGGGGRVGGKELESEREMGDIDYIPLNFRGCWTLTTYTF
jgi:hypothetical protein